MQWPGDQKQQGPDKTGIKSLFRCKTYITKISSSLSNPRVRALSADKERLLKNMDEEEIITIISIDMTLLDKLRE